MIAYEEFKDDWNNYIQYQLNIGELCEKKNGIDENDNKDNENKINNKDNIKSDAYNNTYSNKWNDEASPKQKGYINALLFEKKQISKKEDRLDFLTAELGEEVKIINETKTGYGITKKQASHIIELLLK